MLRAGRLAFGSLVAPRPPIIRRKWLGVSVNVPGVVLHPLPLRVADEIAWGVERTIRGNLSRYGLPRPPVGLATQSATTQQAPAYDAGFVASVKAGRIEIIAAVEG